MGNVSNDAESFDHLPCIALDGDGIPMVLVRWEDSVIVWDVWDIEENNIPDTPDWYWVAVNIPDQALASYLKSDPLSEPVFMEGSGTLGDGSPMARFFESFLGEGRAHTNDEVIDLGKDLFD
ncbi:MAG: hypothetical protein PHT88_01170 [Candidatus Moranbacteria bacterium]|nr:hypothetical protein [Candidatus Moranbacteria bacterium]